MAEEAVQEVDVPACAVPGQVSGTWSILFPPGKHSQDFDVQGWISARLFTATVGNQLCDLSVCQFTHMETFFPPFRLI